jgi:hypothetical protein
VKDGNWRSLLAEKNPGDTKSMAYILSRADPQRLTTIHYSAYDPLQSTPRLALASAGASFCWPGNQFPRTPGRFKAPKHFQQTKGG